MSTDIEFSVKLGGHVALLRLWWRHISDVEKHMHFGHLVRFERVAVRDDINLMNLFVAKFSPGSSQHNLNMPRI